MTNLVNTSLDNVHGVDYVNSTNFGGVVTYSISTFGSTVHHNNNGSVTKNLWVPSVMFFLGVLGNVSALIILTVRPSKDSKSTAFYHLVKALVCMDLFGIVASSPITIVVYIMNGVIETGGMPLCHYFSFILGMAGNATVIIVLVMAAERYMVTKCPFKYNRLVTPLTVNCTILVVWTLSTLIAMFPIFGMGGNIEPWPGTWCFFDYRSKSIGGKIFSYLYASAGLLAIIITIMLNLTVIRHLWRMRRSRLSTTSLRSSEHFSNSRDRGGPDSEKRMVIFLMAITVVFTVCYAPLMVRVIMNQMLNSDPDSELNLGRGGLDDQIDLWALRLACFNQILDPWVYIISRFTCCQGSRDRSREVQSHSSKSYHAVALTQNKLSVSSSQDCRQKESPFVRTFQNIRHFFRRKSFHSGDKETVTLPLQPTLTHTITPTSENGTKMRTLKEELYA